MSESRNRNLATNGDVLGNKVNGHGGEKLENEDYLKENPSIETNIRNWKCCRFQDLPKWLQDNDYIHEGYRPALPSFKTCFKSIFRVHTETGNIWTHLLSCIVFIGILFDFITRPQLEAAFQEKVVFSIFFIGAVSCLGLSSTYHTVQCHSETVGKYFKKLDYLGIALLIMGSFVPWLYYGFYCDIFVRNVYMTITFALGSASIFTSLHSKFGQSKFRTIRACVFAGFGLSAVLPGVHFMVVKGVAYSFEHLALGYLISMAVLYLTGAALYAARIPERWYPGKCDLLFHSHQIFHVLVFVAAMVFYRGIIILSSQALLEKKC